MIRKLDAQRVVANENMRGGKGCVHITHLYEKDNDEFYGKGRLFAKITLQPGESIGYHVHEGETEMFYFASGSGRVCDDGEWYDVTAGDSMTTPGGHGHAVENTGAEDLVLVAVIILD